MFSVKAEQSYNSEKDEAVVTLTIAGFSEITAFNLGKGKKETKMEHLRASLLYLTRNLVARAMEEYSD